MASLQYSIPVHAIAARRNCDGWTQLERGELMRQGFGAVALDVEDDELLMGREPDPARSVLVGQVGDAPEDLAEIRPTVGAAPT